VNESTKRVGAELHISDIHLWCNDAFLRRCTMPVMPWANSFRGRLRNAYDAGLATSDGNEYMLASACECEEAVTIDLHALTRHHGKQRRRAPQCVCVCVETCNQPLTAWPRSVSPPCRSSRRGGHDEQEKGTLAAYGN
jgi:hypothetical protein